jgi:hypothetical protein
MSYPGLTEESAPLWIARETGILKEYGIDANLVYMEGGLLGPAKFMRRRFPRSSFPSRKSAV